MDKHEAEALARPFVARVKEAIGMSFDPGWPLAERLRVTAEIVATKLESEPAPAEEAADDDYVDELAEGRPADE